MNTNNNKQASGEEKNERMEKKVKKILLNIINNN